MSGSPPATGGSVAIVLSSSGASTPPVRPAAVTLSRSSSDSDLLANPALAAAVARRKSNEQHASAVAVAASLCTNNSDLHLQLHPPLSSFSSAPPPDAAEDASLPSLSSAPPLDRTPTATDAKARPVVALSPSPPLSPASAAADSLLLSGATDPAPPPGPATGAVKEELSPEPEPREVRVATTPTSVPGHTDPGSPAMATPKPVSAAQQRLLKRYGSSQSLGRDLSSPPAAETVTPTRAAEFPPAVSPPPPAAAPTPPGLGSPPSSAPASAGLGSPVTVTPQRDPATASPAPLSASQQRQLSRYSNRGPQGAGSPVSQGGPGMRRGLPSSPSMSSLGALVDLTVPERLSHITRQMLELSDKEEGKGAYARVLRGNLHQPGHPSKPVAVKVMNKRAVGGSSFVNLQQEIDVCALLQHDCVINTLGVLQDEEEIFIVMDLAEKGELLRYMKKFGLEDMPQVAPEFVAEVVLGLEHMLQRGVLHRDMKPENLLLTNDYHVKIADFGTACHVRDAVTAPFTGTPLYVSPEMCKAGGHATVSSDVWALGCIIYELFVGRPPFQGATEYVIMQKAQLRELTFPPYFPAEARDLVDRCLQVDPAARITFPDMKDHKFFRCVDWDIVTSESHETANTVDYTHQVRAFLYEGETVLYAGRVMKERWRALSVKERLLVLTSQQHIFYIDPGTGEKKGDIKWGQTLCAQMESRTRFVITTKDRDYIFEDPSGRAHLWASKINHEAAQAKAAARIAQRK